MKFNDAVNGVFVLSIGIAVIFLSGDFKELRHIEYGPGLFPTLVGSGLVAAGLLLMLRWLVSHRRNVLDAGDAVADEPRHDAPSMLLQVLAVVFYIATIDFLGFLITMPVMLFCLTWWFDGRVLRSAVVAVAGTLVIHSFFYQVMSVPLPWGVLEPFAQALTW